MKGREEEKERRGSVQHVISQQLSLSSQQHHRIIDQELDFSTQLIMELEMVHHQLPLTPSTISTSTSTTSSSSPTSTSPPSWAPNRDFEGPWFEQQLILASTIGLLAFLAFCLIRRNHTALFSPRTNLKGFSPPAPGLNHGIFSWIRPTIKAKELDILHIVGLDAAVLLSFFKMSFWLFTCISIWSVEAKRGCGLEVATSEELERAMVLEA